MSASRAAKTLALLMLFALAAAVSAGALELGPAAAARANVANDGLEACTFFLTII